MSELLQVDGHPGLARSKKTGAVVNINKSSINQARVAKELRKARDLKEDQQEQRLCNLENQMDQMLMILRKIAENNG